MAQVKVRLMGTLRRVMGREEIELTIESSAEVAQVIQGLFDKLGGEAPIDLKNPIAETLILINGIEINNLGGLKTPIEDGDVLVLIPVTHGG